MNGWKTTVVFILIAALLSCSYQPPIIKKGQLLETETRLDESQISRYLPVIGAIHVPDENNPFLEVTVRRLPLIPEVKVYRYERLVADPEDSQMMGMLYGLIGGSVVYGLANGFQSFADSSGVKTGNLVGVMVMSGLGMLLGAAISRNPTPKPQGTLEEVSHEVVWLHPGELDGGFPGQLVTVEAPFLHQKIQKETDAHGIARFDLGSELYVDEWPRNLAKLTLRIKVADSVAVVRVDPRKFLLPYFKFTRNDNIRRGPGTGYRVMARAQAGERYRIVDRRGNWFKINYRGQLGWTHRSNGKEVLGTEYHLDPSRPPAITARVKFQEPSGNGMLDAEETATLRVTLINQGRGTAYNLRCRLQPLQASRYIRYRLPQPVPALSPQDSVQLTISLTADRRVPTQKNRFRLSFQEQFGFAPDPVEVVFQSRKEFPPHLVIRHIKIDDDANGNSFGDNDGQIELGETIETEVTIANTGTGEAKDVTVSLVATTPNIFLGNPTTFSLGRIPPGASRSFSFIFTTSRQYQGKSRLPLYAVIREKRSRFSPGKVSLGLELNRFMAGTTTLQVHPRQSAQPRDPVNIEVVPRTGIRHPDDIAVIIGNREYQKPGVPAVRYASRDAALMREYLIRMMGFSPENIFYLENATKADMERLFGTADNPHGRLAYYVVPGVSSVFVYYTGHGAPDVESGESYFVPVDCDPNDVKLTGYPLNLFYRNLSKIPAKQFTVVIDACFSGQSSGGNLITNISSLFLKIKDPVLHVPNLTLFTSSKGNQVSHWYPDYQHSLFTYYFLRGMKIQWQQQHAVTAGELFRYVQQEVSKMARRLYGRDQTPTFYGDEARNLLQ